MSRMTSRRRLGRVAIMVGCLAILSGAAWIPMVASGQTDRASAAPSAASTSCLTYNAVAMCVSPPGGPPGMSVTLSGTGWPFNDTVSLYFLDSAGKFYAGGVFGTATGSWTIQATVPGDAAFGIGYWEAGAINGSAAAVPFDVTSGPVPTDTATSVPPSSTATTQPANTAVPPTGTVGTPSSAPAPTATNTLNPTVPPGTPVVTATGTATPIPSQGYCIDDTYYQTCIQPAQGPVNGPCAVGVYIQGLPYNGGLGYPPYQQFAIYFTDSAGKTTGLLTVGTGSGHTLSAQVFLPPSTPTGVGNFVITDSFGTIYATLPFDVTLTCTAPNAAAATSTVQAQAPATPTPTATGGGNVIYTGPH